MKGQFSPKILISGLYHHRLLPSPSSINPLLHLHHKSNSKSPISNYITFSIPPSFKSPTTTEQLSFSGENNHQTSINNRREIQLDYFPENQFNCVAKMVVIDQHIVGIFVVSLLGFVLLFSIFRDVKSKSKSKANKKKDGRNSVGVQTEVARSSDDVCNVSDGPDVIIVGAGVAGAALACTLAKVMLIWNYYVPLFVCLLARLMVMLIWNYYVCCQIAVFGLKFSTCRRQRASNF